MCSHAAKAMLLFKSDALVLGCYIGLMAKDVDAVCVEFHKIVQRQKTTKCEFKILRNFFKGADPAKKQKSVEKARDELTSRPHMVDYASWVHPAVQEVAKQVIAAASELT